jgi:hypothetical protein
VHERCVTTRSVRSSDATVGPHVSLGHENLSLEFKM